MKTKKSFCFFFPGQTIPSMIMMMTMMTTRFSLEKWVGNKREIRTGLLGCTQSQFTQNKELNNHDCLFFLFRDRGVQKNIPDSYTKRVVV
mmetsp:Transcript_19463/g.45293  ORF Transcript_19463/g.45293 Transcript_19463/m.45293 type:complete len:90 (-) Transcript_19463:603-872(-)